MSSAGQVTSPPFLFGIVLTQRNENLVGWGKGWTDHPRVPACGLFLTWLPTWPEADASHCMNFHPFIAMLYLPIQVY